MKKILIPTDFSACADKAVSSALKLAETNDFEIHFMHIAHVPVDWQTHEDSSKLYPEVSKTVKDHHLHLDQLVQKAESMGIAARKFLIFNKNYHAIIAHTEREKIDLVVMGSTGATGLKGLLLGSNTQKIVRLSQVPVLVIKDDLSEQFELKHMVFVSDFQEQVINQFKSYVAFVQSLNAKLSLLFINTPENFTDSLTTKLVMGNYAMHAPGAVENTHVFNSYNFMEGLETFCKEHQIDAIGMITHGTGSGLHLFNSSLTEKVVNQAKIPVLTMHFDE